MNFGQIPPNDPNMGSWFTKIRDGLKLENTLTITTKAVKDAADKVGIKPISQAAAVGDQLANKLADEIHRAERNPVVIKVVSIVVAAVLTYFGQGQLAMSALKAGFTYAKTVQIKNDIRKTKEENAKDATAADQVNSLLPYMTEADQVIVANAYNVNGYAGLTPTPVATIMKNAATLKKLVEDKIATLPEAKLNAAALTYDKTGTIVDPDIIAIVNTTMAQYRQSVLPVPVSSSARPDMQYTTNPQQGNTSKTSVVSLPAQETVTNNSTNTLNTIINSIQNSLNHIPPDVKKYLPYAIGAALLLKKLRK